MSNTNWIEKLGRNTDYVHVDGNRVVNGFDDPGHDSGGMKVLWTCDTPEQAEEVMDEWLNQVIKERVEAAPRLEVDANGPSPGTYAYTARMMAQLSPVDGDPDFWDSWKDEMKERDLFEDR
jgi:hypothetical protein